MRTNLIAFLGLVACGHNPPSSAPAAQNEVARAAEKPSSETHPVSSTLRLGDDIAKLCGVAQVQSTEDAPKFDFDSTELLPDDLRVLDQIAACLTTGPLKGRSLMLVGRADPRGPETYNMALGAKRAHQVTDYLERKGVPKINMTSRGSLDATGVDEAGWRKDRRVDLVLGS